MNLKLTMVSIIIPHITVEQAGGQCLPCVMDIRHEDEVSKAVDVAVKRFGGIDIVVNNAGAISLTGTLDTSMKKLVKHTVLLSYQANALINMCMCV